MATAVRQPDLSAYFDRSVSKTEISKTASTYTESDIFSLYTSPDLTHQIGNYILDIKAYIQSNVEVAREINTIVSLPFGTLSAQRTDRFRSTLTPISEVGPNIPSPNSFALSNEILIYTILSGNEDFIGSNGYVTITTNNTSIRRLDIWLNKQ